MSLYLKLKFKNHLKDLSIDILFSAISIVGILFIFSEYNYDDLSNFILKIIFLTFTINIIYFSIFEALDIYDNQKDVDLKMMKGNILKVKFMSFITAFIYYSIEFIISLVLYTILFSLSFDFILVLQLFFMQFIIGCIINIFINILLDVVKLNFHVLNFTIDFYNFSSQTYFPVIIISKFMIVFSLFNLTSYLNNIIENQSYYVITLLMLLVILIVCTIVYSRRFNNA